MAVEGGEREARGETCGGRDKVTFDNTLLYTNILISHHINPLKKKKEIKACIGWMDSGIVIDRT